MNIIDICSTLLSSFHASPQISTICRHVVLFESTTSVGSTFLASATLNSQNPLSSTWESSRLEDLLPPIPLNIWLGSPPWVQPLRISILKFSSLLTRHLLEWKICWHVHPQSMTVLSLRFLDLLNQINGLGILLSINGRYPLRVPEFWELKSQSFYLLPKYIEYCNVSS